MKSVIIAEDDADLRCDCAREVKGLFGEAEVDVVVSGADLVEKVKQKHYDLILTDNNMPRMSGLVAIGRIREFNTSVPICLMSGDNPEEIMPEAMRLGATDYIEKGMGFRERLIEVIKKYL